MIKGTHIDCRGQKLRADAVLTVLDDLHSFGYNTVIMEYMDAFPFEGKLAGISSEDAYTKEEIGSFVKRAAELDIELIPLVQTFGHLYWVFCHDEFMPLAEGYAPDPETGIMPLSEICSENGAMKLKTLCPSNPGSIELVREMIRQIRALHPNSKYFHIGGDEIGLPSCPRCKKKLETESLPELLAAHYGACADAVRELGAVPIVWCDILLAYPETLNILKGKFAVMDWDYWSDGKPTKGGRLWGMTDLIHEPDKWPPLQQKLFRPYIFEHEPDLIKPFPFTDLLRDLGYEVFLASAARSWGDSFCVPMDAHHANVAAAARKAAESGISGYIVTSWSVRRSPWHMTEYSLMLASAAADGVTDEKELKRKFALRHFGVEDDELGELPVLLGHASTVAGECALILHSLNGSSDYRTGALFSPEYNEDFIGICRDNSIYAEPEKFVESFKPLREAIPEARRRLEKASPDGLFTDLWRWTLDVFELYCDAAPRLTEHEIAPDDAECLELISRAEALKEKTVALLSPIYTDRTVKGELQCRFSVLIHGIKRRMGLTYERYD